MVILVDKREKNIDHLIKYFDKAKIEYKNKSLAYGDYSFYVPKNEGFSIPRDIYFDKKLSLKERHRLKNLVEILQKKETGLKRN